MTDDLIERLRDLWRREDHPQVSVALAEAAYALEQQAARIAELIESSRVLGTLGEGYAIRIAELERERAEDRKAQDTGKKRHDADANYKQVKLK